MPVRPTVSRRDFLGRSARNAATVAAGVMGLGAADSSERIRVGLIGLGDQGRQLAQLFSARPDVQITALCDVDVRRAAEAQGEIETSTGQRPPLVSHFPAVLERSDVDAVVIATPAHWHPRLAAEACRAGKDVYLEQPVGLTIAEGKSLVEIARQTGRIVQTGLPQRSGPHFQSAVAAIQTGEIGEVHTAKAWAVHKRRPLGVSTSTVPPLGVDYRQWLGSAPAREFSWNRFHQHWPWFWDYGAGELGVWGVQLLDVVRWGLQLDMPKYAAAAGGIRVLHDGRETPDTLKVFFEYDDLTVAWEHRQWSSRGIEGRTAGVAFYGTEGTLIVDRGGWKIYDRKESLAAPASEIHAAHVADFLNSVRTRELPAADIALGARSMALCHLGNLAYRTGQVVHWDQLLDSPVDTPEIQQLASHSMDWPAAEV